MARKETKRSSRWQRSRRHSAPEVSDQSVRELAQVFKLLSDETRLRILFYLALRPTASSMSPTCATGSARASPR